MNPAAIDDMSWAMAEVYGAVADQILINLAHHFKYVQAKGEITGSFEYQSHMLAQMGQVRQETIAIMAQSLGGADEALKAALETAIFEALKTEEPKLRKAAEKGLLRGGVPELSPNQLQAFRAYYRQSADKLNLVNTVMLESTQNAYIATVSDVVQKINRSQSILNTATGEVVTGVSSWNQALHSAVQKMVSNGLTGFIDHGGHKWSPEAYVAMDIRTTMFNTSRAAIWERSEQYGNDLYQVSSHQGARPLCYPWQGKVISTTGRTGTTEDLDGNTVVIHSESEIESFRYGGGLFGVNCGHYPMVFIPGVSTLKGEPQDPEENAKTYAESQQQRALERKLREEKRDLEVMKAQGASPQEIAAQKERVKKADSDIEQFCQDTGRARKKSREYTPVNAEFPEIKKEPPVIPRPDNEQEVLKQFKRYDVSTKTAEEKLAQANPNYKDGGKEWTYNCQRTVVAEELIYRGYDVTAMPYNAKDALKDSGVKCWKFNKSNWWGDKDVRIASRSNLKKKVEESFEEWGDGARAVIRLKWSRNYGGNGHFVFAIRENGSIRYVDPQSGSGINLAGKLQRCTSGNNQLWVMRVDNRELTDLVKYAVKNVGE